MNKPLRLAIIGAGGIAQTYGSVVKDWDIARLVAIVDTNIAAARALAERTGCRSYDSHVTMHENENVDAVIVCTPPVTHPEICLYFLNSRVHVLCEKPLSISSKDARRMLDAARAADVRFTMASKFRYVDDVIRAKSIVASGLLGEIVLFENSFASRVDMSCRWNSNPAISGGGVLIDNGTHSVDLMRYFLGPLAEIQVVEGKRVQTLPVEDTVRLFARSQSGVLGTADLSWSINKETDSFINVYGSRGTVVVGWKQSKYRDSTSGDWLVFGNGYNKLEAFRGEVANFCRAILDHEPLAIDAADALASVEAIETGYRALRRNRWTAIVRQESNHRRSNGSSPLDVYPQ